MKDAIILISKSITIPTKLSEAPNLEEIFNLIPEINSKENLKCLFSILFAEISKHKGNILLEKLLLENVFTYLINMFGQYSIVLLPITLSLSNAYNELGLIDDYYACLNKALKIAYFNENFNSLEVIEVLNQFILFSKYINEQNEEGIYSEILGKIIQNNLQILDKKNKSIKLEKDDNSKEKQDEQNKTKNNNKSLFNNFKILPYENKLEILVQISYLLRHVDYMSTYGKIGKNTDYILKKFNYCNELMENIGILNDDKNIFNFDLIINDLNKEKIYIKSFTNDLNVEDNFIYFYLNPEFKNFIKIKITKNKSNNAKDDNSYANNEEKTTNETNSSNSSKPIF